MIIDGHKVTSKGDTPSPELQPKLESLLKIIGPKVVTSPFPDTEEYERIVRDILDWGRREMEAGEIFPVLFFIICQNDLYVSPAFFEGSEELDEELSRVHALAGEMQAKAIVVLADALKRDSEKEEERTSTLSCIAFGQWINIGQTWDYVSHDEKPVFSDQPSEQKTGTYVSFMPWWDIGPIN